MASVNPYLNFHGNTEEAFNFYRSVFGGEFLALQRFSDTEHGASLPDHEKNMIMHIALPFGNGNIIMGTDTLASTGQTLEKGNNVSLCVTPDTKEEGERLFKGLSQGGTVTLPYEKAFWGAYFGMLTDKFGVQWMINYDEKK